MGAKAVADQGQAGLGLEGVVRVAKGAVEGVDGPSQGGSGDVGSVDGGTGQAFVEHIGGEVPAVVHFRA